MGCDIHMFCERQVGDTWIALRTYDEWCDHHPQLGYDTFSLEGWYDDRNYSLFGILAEVRTLPEKSLGSPRGLPHDCSSIVRKESNAWGRDAHCHSYFTLEELKAFDWDGNHITQSYFVPPKVAKKFRKTGIAPDEPWSYRYAADLEEITWEESSRVYCPGFISLMKEMEELGDPDKVRIVFWFDN